MVMTFPGIKIEQLITAEDILHSITEMAGQDYQVDPKVTEEMLSRELHTRMSREQAAL
jgi:hypothetical protein